MRLLFSPQTPSNSKCQCHTPVLGSPGQCRTPPRAESSLSFALVRSHSPESSAPFQVHHRSQFWWRLEKQTAPKLINCLRSYEYQCPWSGVLRQRCRWACSALLCTFVDDVADGLCAESVVQRYRHHGVCVTGQLWDGPLRERTDQHHQHVFEVNDNNCRD